MGFAFALMLSWAVPARAATNVRLDYDTIALKSNASEQYLVIPDSQVVVRFADPAATLEDNLTIAVASVEGNDNAALDDAIQPALIEQVDDGWQSVVKMPKLSGVYDVVLNKASGEETLVQVSVVNLPVILDPTGQPAYGGRVTLYVRDEKGLWQIWKSPEAFQKNPKTIGIDGRYAYYVQPGEYRILIQSSGAADFNSAPQRIEQAQILTLAAQLNFDEQAAEVEFDTSIVSVVSALLDQLDKLKKNAEIVNVTKNALQPFSYLAALAAIFSFALSFIFQFGIGMSALPMLPMHVAQIFMQIIGRKRNRLPWGKVYDYKYSMPIPQASILLFHEDDHKLVQMATSDLEGNYSFEVKEGKYSIFASKKNYQFPVPGAKLVYDGTPFFLNIGDNPTYNIAMDYLGEKPAKISKPVAASRGAASLGKWLFLVAALISALWNAFFAGNILAYGLVVVYIFIMYIQFKKDQRSHTVKNIEGL